MYRVHGISVNRSLEKCIVSTNDPGSESLKLKQHQLTIFILSDDLLQVSLRSLNEEDSFSNNCCKCQWKVIKCVYFIQQNRMERKT